MNLIPLVSEGDVPKGSFKNSAIHPCAKADGFTLFRPPHEPSNLTIDPLFFMDLFGILNFEFLFLSWET
jgi:hypothetical protein